MAAEKNQRYLLVILRRRICGIDCMKLITPEEKEEEAVDWENLPPFPFDFSLDLPMAWMQALEFDSKIYLVGGREYFYEHPLTLNGAFHLSEKIYQLDLDKKEVKSFCKGTWWIDSLKDPIHKIRSDYYFVVMAGSVPMSNPYNFWVLRSGTMVPEYLPEAPSHPPGDVVGNSWFNFYGKLYLRLSMEDGSIFIHSYDTLNPLKDWTTCQGDNTFTRSFCVTVAADGQRRFFPPSVHIPDLVDPGKYLALSCERIGEKYVMCAFQVDELGVLIFQRLQGCFDRMPSSFIHEKTPKLVDLDGKGTFVVMLSGFANEEKQDSVLCVLVLQVIPKKVVNCCPARVLRRSPRFPTECEFLDWNVLNMNMYSVKRVVDDWSAVSIFPGVPCDEAIVYRFPRRGKRKYSQI